MRMAMAPPPLSTQQTAMLLRERHEERDRTKNLGRVPIIRCRGPLRQIMEPNHQMRRVMRIVIAAAVDTANDNATTGTPRRAGPHEESRPRADHPLSRPIATNNGTEASDANGDANGDGAAAAVDAANGNTTDIIELSVYITIMGCGASTRPSILSQLDDSIPVMMRRAGPYKAHCNKWNRCWDILADAPGYECMNSDVGRTSCHSTNTII